MTRMARACSPPTVATGRVDGLKAGTRMQPQARVAVVTVAARVAARAGVTVAVTAGVGVAVAVAAAAGVMTPATAAVTAVITTVAAAAGCALIALVVDDIATSRRTTEGAHTPWYPLTPSVAATATVIVAATVAVAVVAVAVAVAVAVIRSGLPLAMVQADRHGRGATVVPNGGSARLVSHRGAHGAGRRGDPNARALLHRRVKSTPVLQSLPVRGSWRLWWEF